MPDTELEKRLRALGAEAPDERVRFTGRELIERARLQHRRSVALGAATVAAAVVAAMFAIAPLYRGPETNEPVPAGPDSSATPTPTDAESQRLADLAQLAADMGLESPPDVAVVRYIGHEEQADVMATCMTSFGHPPDEETGGYDTGGVALADNEEVATALYTCAARYPIDPTFLHPLTDDQIVMIYEYTRDVMIPCYNARGWAIDVSALSSEDEFVEAFGTEDAWTPPPPTRPFTPQWVRDVRRGCPAQPSSAELWGTSDP